MNLRVKKAKNEEFSTKIYEVHSRDEDESQTIAETEDEEDPEGEDAVIYRGMSTTILRKTRNIHDDTVQESLTKNFSNNDSMVLDSVSDLDGGLRKISTAKEETVVIKTPFPNNGTKTKDNSSFCENNGSSSSMNENLDDILTRLNNEYNILSRHFPSQSPSPLLSTIITTRSNSEKVKGETVKSSCYSNRRLQSSLNRMPSLSSISSYSSKSVRGVLGRVTDKNNRLQSIQLEYVKGVSVTDWIEANPIRSRIEETSKSEKKKENNTKETTSNDSPWEKMILDRLCVASGIAGALADVHDAGVMHNDVVPSSFIVDTPCRVASSSSSSISFSSRLASSSSSMSFSSSLSSALLSENNSCNTNPSDNVACSWPVTIISFGHATYGQSIEADDCGDRVNDDIPALGYVLRTLFSDKKKVKMQECDEKYRKNPYPMTNTDDFFVQFENNYFRSKEDGDKKRKNRRHEYLNSSLLLPDDLPRPITHLISNLINMGGKSQVNHYKAARDVQEDINQMIHDPKTFLFCNDSEYENINFSKMKLYGRSNEMQLLQEACRRIATAANGGGDTPDGDNDDMACCHRSASVRSLASIGHSVKSCTTNRSHRVRGRGRGRGRDREGNAEIVFVSGQSGVGKSELVRRACEAKITSEANGYYIHGKYDQLHRAQPYSAFIVAFTDLCDKIIDRGQAVLNEMSQKIRLAVGTLGNVITDVIPSLEKIIGKQPSVSKLDISGSELQNRFNFVFRMFIRAISDPSHPIVLVLDDLQWADSSSLNLLNMLLNDTCHHSSMLFVCCYRDNEVDHSHPLSKVIREINQRRNNTDIEMSTKSLVSSSNGQDLTDIRIGHLKRDAVGDLVSDILRMSKRLTRPLSDMVHRKTGGNAFFVVQFLKSLYDEHILTYSQDTQSWKWNVNELHWKNMPDNVVELMAGKIRKLSPRTQTFVKVAAAVGSYFEASIISLAMKGKSDIKLKESVETTGSCENTKLCHCTKCCTTEITTLLNEGLILQFRSSGYRFAHDRIQQAAYSLVKEDELMPLHLNIGRVMFQLITRDKEGKEVEEIYSGEESGSSDGNTPSSKLLFTTADHLNNGSALITDQQERIELAKLNLKVGKMAMQSSAFGPASVYLKSGINILLLPSSLSKANNHEDENYRWENHYNLTLKLYNNLAEADYCNGDFDEVEHAVNIILKNAVSIDDKVSAYTVLINLSTARNSYNQGFKIGLGVLSQLGESFPSKKVTMRAVVGDLMKTKLMLRGKTDAKLLALPTMTNRRKYMAMVILSRLYTCAVQGSQHAYLPLVFNRLVQITINHGVCDISPFGFALFGVTLGGVLGDIPNGCRYGELGLELMERFDTSHKFYSRVLGTLTNSIWSWTKSPHDLIEPSVRVHQMGMDHGDNEYAMYGIWNVSLNSILSGKPLEQLANDMKSYAQLMTELGQNGPRTIFLPLWQFVLNLIGASENPVIMTGEAMDQEDILQGPNPMSSCDTCIFALVLAYLFHDYDLADQMSERSKDASKIHPGMSTVWLRVFYDALNSFAMARQNVLKRKKWLKRAGKSMSQIKKWIKHSECVFLHKYKLLQAEELVLKDEKNREAIVNAYDEAIITAGKNGFIHEEALANERVSLYLLDIVGDQRDGSRYLDRANQLYLEWGAHSKVKH